MNKRLDNYQKLMHDPRWIAKSKKIIARDKWCQKCYAQKNLQAHHLGYLNGRKPWEYPDDWFVTLCEKCHKGETKDVKRLSDIVLEIKVSGMWAGEIIDKFFGRINND